MRSGRRISFGFQFYMEAPFPAIFGCLALLQISIDKILPNQIRSDTGSTSQFTPMHKKVCRKSAQTAQAPQQIYSGNQPDLIEHTYI
jgi:hypothetical protein